MQINENGPIQSLQVIYRPVAELVPYARNARTHSPEQVRQIAASIVEYGFTNPVLIDAEGGIVAGHGRVMAVHQLGMQTVATITLGHLSEAQKRAYVIADNKLALNAGWDLETLKLELLELGEAAYDLELTGFDGPELIELFAGEGAWGDGGTAAYVQAINAPSYEPKGDRPEVGQLYDQTKAAELLQGIDEAVDAGRITSDEARFLAAAAARHVVFDYHQIAEYYCHASPALQQLMEQSALVIIDLDKAIAGGFVRMSQRLDEVYANTYSNEQP